MSQPVQTKKPRPVFNPGPVSFRAEAAAQIMAQLVGEEFKTNSTEEMQKMMPELAQLAVLASEELMHALLAP